MGDGTSQDAKGRRLSPGHRDHLAGALLRDTRCRAGLTQAALAERAGVVRPLISQYETGKKDPSVTMLARLIDACGMELRMVASRLTDADRRQYVRDAAVGEAQGRRNAERLRHEVVSIRRPTPDEMTWLRGDGRAAS
jgi:transcriptional regulator with XRE-family HTH domain